MLSRLNRGSQLTSEVRKPLEQKAPFLPKVRGDAPTAGIPTLTTRRDDEARHCEQIGGEVFNVKVVAKRYHIMAQGFVRHSIDKRIVDVFQLDLKWAQRGRHVGRGRTRFGNVGCCTWNTKYNSIVIKCGVDGKDWKCEMRVVLAQFRPWWGREASR